MKHKIFITLCIIFAYGASYSQGNVIITDEGSHVADPSSMLDVYSTSKGMLVPRLTNAQIALVSSPATGLLIFNLDSNSFNFFNGSDWIDLSNSPEIWSENTSTVFLSDQTKNVGIGTSSASGKLIIQADNDEIDSDPLFEVKDKLGNTVFSVTSEGVRVYVKDYTTGKGISGGFAVGRYGTAKGLPDTTFLFVTGDSTRVYTKELVSKGISGGFAVGRYGTAKGPVKHCFSTNPDSTRVYLKDPAKGISGGFAVGRYGTAKNVANTFFHTGKDSTRVYVPDGGDAGKIGGFAVTGNNAGVTDDYFNVTGNLDVELINNKKKIMWYPQKSAFLGGEIHVGSADSVGTNSVALGYRAISMGNWSQAFGYKSQALGDYSTAIGFQAEAKLNSLAAGYLAKATGNSSFAFGYGAEASGDNSYALGSVGLDSLGVVTNNTQAIGEYSFAFGLGSISSGKGAVAFGTNNTSSGQYSTTIGYKNQSTKYYSTAMGAYSQATGDFSTAIGYFNQATDVASSAFGYNTRAVGYSSFSAGLETNASGYVSFAMGYRAKAAGSYSLSIGNNTNATGHYSAAFGSGTTSVGQYSLVFGSNSSTNVSGLYSIAGGYNCTANSSMSVSLGRQCQTTGSTSAAIGYLNTAGNASTIALGQSTTASGLNSMSTGFTTIASGNYSMSAGLGTTAQSYLSAVFGRYNVVAGTTNSWVAAEQLFVVGNGSAGIPNNALTLYKNGNLHVAGVYTSSDSKLKEKIESFGSVLSVIEQIKPVYFEYKNKGMYPENRQIGFVAQDIQKFYPEMVLQGENGMLSVDYSKMTVVLLQAVNEQQVLIKKQAEENALLKNQILEINNKLDLLLSK